MSGIHIFVGGDPVSPERIRGLGPADLVIAADSGAESAAAAGIRVDILVGDLDSISRSTLERVVDAETTIEAHSPDKDATDLELARDVALRHDPSEIVFAGGGGGRLDHLLGNLAVIGGPALRSIPVRWVTDRETAYVVRDHRSVPVDAGVVFSVIPIGGDAHGVKVTGAKWTLDGALIEAGSSLGISNVSLGGMVSIEVGTGAVLAVFNQPTEPPPS